MNYIEQIIHEKIINIHTAFVGKVISITGSAAQVKPLTYSKNMLGNLKEQSPVSAIFPQNVKTRRKKITYRISDYETETITVIVPAELEVGDIVYCGIAERDITSETMSGKIIEPTRHHDINDTVILAVLSTREEAE